MSIILNWVAGHTSCDNPWIVNKLWYKQDASGNVISPPDINYTDVAALNYGLNNGNTVSLTAQLTLQPYAYIVLKK